MRAKESDLEIIYNGQPRRIEPGTTIAGLLASLDSQPRHVAVEVNRQLVPRHRHGERQLCQGDRVEVVTLVGGG